jgi:hypothetical protein
MSWTSGVSPFHAPVLAERHVSDPGLEQLVDQAEVPEHFLAARAQPLTARPPGKLGRLVDDAHRDAAPGQVAGEREAGRAGTDHENISLRHSQHLSVTKLKMQLG